MIEEKIKESMNHISLSNEEKECLYDRIITEAASSPDKIVPIGRKKKMKKLSAACVAAVMLCCGSVGVYAAYQWLTPDQVAYEMEDEKLAKAFGKKKSELQIQESGKYRVAYLGIVSGKEIGHTIIADGMLSEDRTYVVVAIEQKDGTAMELDKDTFFISPFISGLKPWQYNIYSMNGDSSSVVKDGILYSILACDNIEMFAKNKIYLGVQSGQGYDTDAYNYDEKSGEITRSESYEGVNLLFDLELDSSKADEAAAAFIEEKNKEDRDSQEVEETTTEEEMVVNKETAVVDQKNNLTLKLWENNHFYGVSGDDEYISSYFGLYSEVVGENIDTITYTLEKGTFYKKEEATEQEAEQAVKNSDEYVYEISKEYKDSSRLGDKNKTRWLLKGAGSSYTVRYEEQNTLDHLYTIGVQAKANHSQDLNREECYRALAERMDGSKIPVQIRYKDGHIVNKELVFHKVDSEICARMVIVEWK